MDLSICIPLYNKSNYLKSTLKCIEEVYGKFLYEIILVNNCSSDINKSEISLLVSPFKNIRLYHLPATISVQENWGICLSLARGKIVKLQLADDLVPQYDFNKIINLLDTSDFVVGKTSLLNNSNSQTLNYFHRVNSNRKLLFENTEKPNYDVLIESFMYYNGFNPFGDVNAVFLNNTCVEKIISNIKYYLPVFQNHPDIEIYLTLLINFKGAFINENVSIYNENESSPSNVSRHDERFKKTTYEYMGNILAYELIFNPKYNMVIYNLSNKNKFKLFVKLMYKMFSAIIRND